MSQRIVTECDECADAGETRTAQTVVVRALGHEVEVDLCEMHTKPLADMVERLAMLGRPVGNHNGEAKCPRCGRTFSTAQALGRHTKKRHGETVREARAATVATVEPEPAVVATVVGSEPCPECGQTFARPQGLAVHRFRKHGVRGSSRASASRASTREEGDEPPEGESRP